MEKLLYERQKDRIVDGLYNANIKLQDENRYLRNDVNTLKNKLIEINAYITTKKFEKYSNKEIKETILGIIGSANYER